MCASIVDIPWQLALLISRDFNFCEMMQILNKRFTKFCMSATRTQQMISERDFYRTIFSSGKKLLKIGTNFLCLKKWITHC